MSEDAIAFAWVVGLPTFWFAGWKFIKHFNRTQSVPMRSVLLSAHDLVAALPLLWLLATASLVLRGYWRVGEWPHGSDAVVTGQGWPEFRAPNIDARSFGMHYELVYVLGIAVSVSWMFFLPLHHFTWLLGVRRSRFWIAVCVAGFVAFFFILFNADPGDVMEWLDG